VRDLAVAFSGVRALDGVSLEIPGGTVYGVIGPNGAGKTTLVNVISGYQRPDHGSVEIGGVDIRSAARYEMAGIGVARTFQNFRLFESETVLQNVLMGRHRFFAEGPSAFIAPRRERRRQAASAEAAVARVGLERVARETVAGLPYGVRRRVEIARALASEPSVLLLDEPVAGMLRTEADDIGELITAIARSGTCVVVVEHNVRLVSAICARVAVLHFGRLLMEGRPEEVWADALVREAYLGGRATPTPSTASGRSGAP
jgi:branched-chain amino acid transport system ATP-binding protein